MYSSICLPVTLVMRSWKLSANAPRREVEVFDINVALAGAGLGSDQFVHDFADGFRRQTDGVTLEIKFNGFAQTDVFRQPAHDRNVIGDGQVQVNAWLPFAELLHGADIIGTVSACELERFGFTIGKLHGNQFRFAPGFRQIGELPPHAFCARVVGNGVDVALVFDACLSLPVR